MEGQLKNGTILTSESGNKYTVVNLLGAGGQGEVYDVECDGKHYALKWYFKGSATARQKKLLEEIIAKGAPDSSFLWPMELIVPSQGNLFGYIMPLRPKNYKSIVDLMGGLISVESREHEGSRFTVEIPLKLPAQQDRMAVQTHLRAQIQAISPMM